MMSHAAPGNRKAFMGLPVNVSAFAHTSILASAGSGKTHALTDRYLQLVAAGAPIATILASTFTRLAAAEIRDRVLNRLSDAVLDKDKRAELAKSLQLTDERTLTESSAAALLAQLVRHLHVGQLRTLDSFFAAVVRASCIELGLPIGADVIDEEQETALRSEAIVLMLDERKPDELVELLRQLTRGDAGRSVTEAIDSVVAGLYDFWCEAPPEAWECVPTLPGHLKLIDVMAEIEALEAAPSGSAKRHATAKVDDVRRARSFNWEEFLAKGIASKIALGETKYYTELDPALINAYQPLVAHAKAEVVGTLQKQTLATRDMLALFHKQFERLKRVRSAVTFGDLVLWCQRAIAHDSLDTIAFRLDAQVRHVLLDEFQDTSIAQWRALKPIVDEIVATAPPDRSFFCVGDVKQSIYGWRGAAPEVLEELPSILADTTGSAINVRTLAQSFRSSPVVIDVVNQVFEGLPANPALVNHAEIAQAWLTGFTHHESARNDRAGYVELRVVDLVDADGEKGRPKQKSVRLRRAAELAAQLTQQHVDITIGILVRTNASVARLLMELSPSRLNVRASGRGGGPLTDAPAVNALLDLLRMVDHPDDTTAAFNIATSPLGAHVALRDHRSPNARAAVADRTRQDLFAQGYAMTLARLATKLAGECDAREIRRVYQLVELAGQFDQRPSLRADDFVALAEKKAVALAQPARVQVMTVHQSKGLDFDVVILPELEFKLPGHKPPQVLYERAGETGPIARICRYFSRKDMLQLVPELQSLHDRHTRRTVRESLSLLYVAMTRAKHAVHMFIDPPRTNERTISCTAANVLRFALTNDELTPGTTAYVHGNATWMETLDRRGEADDMAMREEKPIRFAPSRKKAHGRVASPSQLAEGADEAKAPAWRDAANFEARERGMAIHELAEQIEWLGDFAMDDAALEHVVQRRLPRRNRDWVQAQVRDFRAMIERPEVAKALSRPAGGGNVFVRRELPMARLMADGVQQGAIDRLVYEVTGGAITRAEVIDFKTDAIRANEVETAAEHHRPQLEAYQRAAAELLGIDPALIVMKIVFLCAGRVVTM